MIAITLFMTFMIKVLAFTGLPNLINIDYGSALLIGFALSFSSTVLAVKVLEEKGAMNSFTGTWL